MHPSHVARTHPDKPAIVFVPSETALSFGELERRVTQAAHLLQDLGVRRGDAVAFCVENSPEFFEIAWAAQRVGAIFTPMSTKLTADDVQYIVEDSGARVFILSAACEASRHSKNAFSPTVKLLSVGGDIDGCADWKQLRQSMPTNAIASPSPGGEMMYSSGTTGRPKGVRKSLPDGEFDVPDSRTVSLSRAFSVSHDSVYLSTSPLYHSAPYRYAATALSCGATCIVMERFDEDMALRCIATYRCTHSIWVPTMFHRLLRLPTEIRALHDTDSLRYAVHGAAPCPIHVKERMIEWWGPILYEYYAGTEGIGACMISSQEWLAHKGSVGRATDGEIHILDEQDEELPLGVTGVVHFKNASSFEYWNAPDKTAGSRSKQGWWTYGDIGHVDADGYLYLTDRKDFMIISGGVNIYPQEIENVLLAHPKVSDAAVFGVPNEEYGEQVTAVVQPVGDPTLYTAADKSELIDFCRRKLGSLKSPRTIEFVDELPRHATGKLYKRLLRERYLQTSEQIAVAVEK
jgi:long-chain acyl-CoA synthetase